MTHDAATQLRRILHLTPQLADGESHSLEAVARLAGTDVDTLLRDLDAISVRFDEPGGFVPGLEIYLESDRISIFTQHFTRPMRLTAPELCALELGLSMLRHERPPEEHVAIDDARARIRATLAALPGEQVADELRDASVADNVDPERLSRLRRAVRDRVRVRIVYQKGADDEATPRVVCPYGLVAARGAWYLVAHCTSASGVRIFRLDRVVGAEPLDERFEIPAEFSLTDVVRDGRVFDAEHPGTLRVRYSPRVARWIAEREGVAPDEDGSLVMEYPLADPNWAVRHVLQYGPDAEVLAPESVRADVVAHLETILAS